MIHTDLYNALRLLRGDLPEVHNGWQAWDAVRPENSGTLLSRTFWHTLRQSLQVAKTGHRQQRIAEWIIDWKERAESTGQEFPPKPIHTYRPLPKAGMSVGEIRETV